MKVVHKLRRTEYVSMSLCRGDDFVSHAWCGYVGYPCSPRWEKATCPKCLKHKPTPTHKDDGKKGGV